MHLRPSSRVVRVLAVLLALGLGLAACNGEPPDPAENDEAEQQAEMEAQRLRAELAEAEGRIDRLEVQLAGAEAQVEQLERQVDAQETEQARADLAEAEHEIARLESDLAEVEAEREALAGQVDEAVDERPAGERTPEGLVEQLHTYFPPEDLPDFEPGTTDWEPVDAPAGFGETDSPGFDTPGALMTALAAEGAGNQLGRDVWEVTTRVLEEQDGTATGALLQWGFADDAVAGSDLRLELVEGSEGWYVESAEQRFHCRRGVTDDGLCE